MPNNVNQTETNSIGWCRYQSSSNWIWISRGLNRNQTRTSKL